MGRRLFLVVGALVPLSLFAFSATAAADEPELLTLSVNSARETCTLGSVTTLDYSIAGGAPPYQLTVDGRVVEGDSTPGYIPCQPSQVWSPLEADGGDGVQRINVSVSDSTGARAYAIAEVRLVPPLPQPTYLKVTSSLTWTADVNLSAEWGTPYMPGEQRTTDFAIRWRVEGTADWTIEHRRSPGRPVFRFRETWRIDASPTGERLVVQVAQIRHIHDLQEPDALVWSESALVTTAAAPHELQAEATHDTITLSWGPHAPGLVYVARLQAVKADRYTYGLDRRVTTGPLYEARFDDLLPDTLYRVEVRLDQEDRYRSPLDAHRFEVRTEPAPEGWSAPSWVPTGITARFLEGELEVSWTPPSTGSRYDTQVCVQPPEHFWLEECRQVTLGESRADIPLRGWVEAGTFAITLTTFSAPAGVAEVDLHVPSYDPGLLTRGAPPEAPQLYRVSWSHHHHEDPEPASWRFQWDHQDAELAEVAWEEDGRRIIRETRESEFDISLGHGRTPGTVRVRLLKDGAWTLWSAEADVSRIDESYRNVRFVERAEVVEVHWDAPADDSDVVGYRLYVSRNYHEGEVIDVGRQVSAEIPITPIDEALKVDVAVRYEGSLEVVHFFPHWWHLLRQQPESFELSMSGEYSPCPPSKQATLTIQWRIWGGGVPPFIVMIGDRMGFETNERSGSTVVECRTRPDGALQEIPGRVIDARGHSAVGRLGRYSFRYAVPEPGVDPLKVHLGVRRVYPERVLLSWECRFWPPTAALRWRLDGAVDWTYAADFPQQHDVDDRCRATWEGLAPLTTYEYQLAKLRRPADLDEPELLQWTQTQTVTTPGPSQDVSIERNGETVAVSWLRQPEARAYVVSLRAEGRSWWKRYEPLGEARETVMFHRVPRSLGADFEFVSRLLVGREVGGWDDYDIHPGHFHE